MSSANTLWHTFPLGRYQVNGNQSIQIILLNKHKPKNATVFSLGSGIEFCPHCRYNYWRVKKINNDKNNKSGGSGGPGGDGNKASVDEADNDRKQDEFHVEDAVKAGFGIMVAGGVSCGIYRLIRLIPSVTPLFWWTLPANIAVP